MNAVTKNTMTAVPNEQHEERGAYDQRPPDERAGKADAAGLRQAEQHAAEAHRRVDER